MHRVKVLSTQFVTHDVSRIIVEKPKGYQFVPGQATEVAINKKDWNVYKRPFTFTSLADDLVLEFIVKHYTGENSVTQQMASLRSGDELLIDDAWGAIQYKGPGLFIAGGAGITPFIAIFRQLKEKQQIADNQLIFSNKTRKDVILEKELRSVFSDNQNLLLTLSGENHQDYRQGRVNKELLSQTIKDIKRPVYLCGPKPMISDISGYLEELGVDSQSLVLEK